MARKSSKNLSPEFDAYIANASKFAQPILKLTAQQRIRCTDPVLPS